MSNVAIVGAGQGGLHLAFGLLQQGHDVTIVSNRRADEFKQLPAMASHTLQAPALERERAAGACASDLVPQNWGVGVDFAISFDGASASQAWLGDWGAPSAALDLRLKYALLLERFERSGGNVVIANATAETLEELAAAHDMVFVATGKADLAGVFEIDEQRTVCDGPQRWLAQMLVRGVRPQGDAPSDRLFFRFLPEHGEIFLGPMLHMSETPIHTFLIEARPGSGFDRFGDVTDPDEAIGVARGIVDELLPWEPAIQQLELADPRAYLKGAIRPLVRTPVAILPSGRPVYAVGDVALVHDPAAGQGGNCTVAYVDHLLATIAAADGAPLTPDLVLERFEDFWEREGQWFTKLAVMLVQPITPPFATILAAADGSKAVADRIASSFAQPRRLMEHVDSEEAALQFVAAAQGGGEPAAAAARA